MGKDDKSRWWNPFKSWVEQQHEPPQPVEDVEEPDKVAQPGGGIDLRFRVGQSRYVLEHTLLYAFPSRAHEDDLFERLIYEPLEGHSIGRFVLVADGTAEQYRQFRHCGAFLCAKILEWIARTAPTLGSHEIRQESPPEIGFRLSLSRLPAGAGGGLRTGRKSRSHTLEGAQGLAESVGKALDAKLPKLARARANADASILLLENDDMTTAGAWNLIPALVRGLQQVEPALVPDLVYLIETYDSNHAYAGRPYLSCIKHGARTFSEAEAYGRIDEDGRWPRLPPPALR